MSLGRRQARKHETGAIQKSAVDASIFADFRKDDHVMTVDGYPGIVASVNDGPYPGTESYDVVLDGGLGGGEYTAGQLSPLTGTTASHEHEAVGVHMASDDYEELRDILRERPPIERVQRYASRGDAGPFVQAASTADDLSRWDYNQKNWDSGFHSQYLEQSKQAGDYTLHAEHPDEEGHRTIHAVTHGGQYVGNTFFGPHPHKEGFQEGAPQVHPQHRRRGLGTAMYDYAEELGGKPMAPAIEHTDDAAAFWQHRHGSLGQFEFQHQERDTGGTQFPRRVDTTVHYPETGEQVGSARYFPPKRKGGPISIDEVKGDVPGAGSAVLNEIEGRHPGSRTVFLHQVKRNNNNPDVTGHAHQRAGQPSDWDTHYPNLAETVHRGLTLRLPERSSRTVNSAGNTKDEHLAELHAAMPQGPSIGTHWTEDEHAARLFAHNAVSDHRTDIPVVLHAHTPELKDFETRQTHLYRGGVFPYGDSHSSENEIPIRKGRQVAVTGISWRPDVEHPEADEHGWLHHTYAEPMHHTANEDHHNTPAFEAGHKDAVYLRFGKWRENERSRNNVIGDHEVGVSVYELNKHGEPMDPDPHMTRGQHEHDDWCDDDCDQNFDEDYGNDTAEEMRGRANRAERNRYGGQDKDHETGHLVKGEMVGIGHDGEPLLQKVKRVGDWINDRHRHIPTAEPHKLAEFDFDHHTAAAGEAPTGEPDPEATTSACSYCGSSDLQTAGDNGRNVQVQCQDCGGMMSGNGGQLQPELIGDPSNHPSPTPDLRAQTNGGVPPVRRMNPSDASTTFTAMHRTARSWDDIGEEHPHIYGDPEVHGDAAHGADGEGIGWAANQLAHDRPDDPGAEETGSWDLEFHEEHVDPKHIDYARHGASDSRVRHAHEGYTSNPEAVPPVVLVHRHGVYQVADGHHRAEAAALAGKKVRAYVAYSPHPDEPFSDGNTAPYHGAVSTIKPEAPEHQHVRDHLLHDHGTRVPSYSKDNNELVSKHERDHWECPHNFDRETGNFRTSSLRAEGSDEHDYRMMHQAPDADYGAPLHDVENIMPGFYDHPHYYNHGQDHFHDSAAKIQKARGNPEHKVRIYRSLPAEHAGKGLNPGDWVTTSKDYARLHGKHNDDSKHDWPVVSTVVPAKHLHTEGDVHEWAYNGPHEPNVSVSFKGGHHQEIRQRADGAIAPVKRKANPFKERESDLKAKGYSFSHYRPTSEDNPHHTVVAYDHQDNWVGQVKAHRNGEVHHVEIQPEHAHEPLEAHMRDMVAREVKKTGSLEATANGTDWCTHRRDGRCTHPLEDGLAPRMASPQDRGPCAWDFWQQQVCPISEPGPMALMQAKGSLKDGELDREGLWHFTAAWSDVREKARRLRSEGSVLITVASSAGVGGEVKGDHNVYETVLNFVPGSQKIGYWTCGCKWSAYAWGRSPAYKRFEGRMCSHALAMQFEAQARGMFGQTVTPDTSRPKWMKHHTPVVVQHERDTHNDLTRRAVPPGNMRRTFEGSLTFEAFMNGQEFAEAVMEEFGRLGGKSPAHDVVHESLKLGAESVTAMGLLLTAGLNHRHAKEILHEVLAAEQFAKCPDCGGRLAADMGPGHRCPHCGNALGELDVPEAHLAAAKETQGPTHAGVVLKAADTGRVLMLQRNLEDEKDPAAGTWEWPGGGIEPGDTTALHGALREWEEEVGQPFPEGGAVHHVWQSPNGVYHGHVVVIPEERQVELHNGRVTVNPDDPGGDHHEQAAWWTVDHAKKNPAIRPECKGSPWKEISKAGGGKEAASWDSLEEFDPGTTPPQHSLSQNPGSTGFATSEDPDSWEHMGETSSLAPSGVYAMLNDEPEPALPSTDGADGDLPMVDPRADMHSEIGMLDQSYTPSPVHGSIQDGSVADIVAQFQSTAAAKSLSSPDGESGEDVAQAAQEFLKKQALKDFKFHEQQELINEGAEANVMARNADVLKIDGTHYAALEEALAAEEALKDPDDLFA